MRGLWRPLHQPIEASGTIDRDRDTFNPLLLPHDDGLSLCQQGMRAAAALFTWNSTHPLRRRAFVPLAPSMYKKALQRLDTIIITPTTTLPHFTNKP
jgi:hypothetical protein